jgi:hypothetical protein
MSRKVEIYALTDPNTGETRYIGKANNAQVRFAGHLRETRRKTPVYCWIRSLRVKGQIPGLKIIAVCDQSDWQTVEKRAIAYARSTNAKLLNVADGGDEPYCAKEVRAENGRKSALSRINTPLKARIYFLKKTMGDLLKGEHVSEATKAKLRYAARKRPDLFGEYASL